MLHKNKDSRFLHSNTQDLNIKYPHPRPQGIPSWSFPLANPSLTRFHYPHSATARRKIPANLAKRRFHYPNSASEELRTPQLNDIFHYLRLFSQNQSKVIFKLYKKNPALPSHIQSSVVRNFFRSPLGIFQQLSAMASRRSGKSRRLVVTFKSHIFKKTKKSSPRVFFNTVLLVAFNCCCVVSWFPIMPI